MIADSRRRTITVTRLSFTTQDFTKLPLEERMLFIRLAHAYNDLRHIQQLVVRAIGALNNYQGIEHEIASHQMLYGLRQWYAALNEAWSVVRTRWGNGVGKKFGPKLTNGKKAYAFLKKYFSHKNLIRTIRDRFANHYETDHLARLLGELNSESGQHFVTTQHGGNIFYNAAESIQNLALIATAGDELGFNESISWTDDVARQAVRKLYDEVCRVSDQFHDLCDDILSLIIKQCRLQRTVLSSSAVSDPETCESVIFVDEEAFIRRHHKKLPVP